MSYCPLDLVEAYLKRFVAYPSKHALVAHTLWIAHTHLLDCFDTTPRLAFMSAEKASGKTRALEITENLVPEALLSFSVSPAVVIRLVSQRRRTLLYDEIDAVFGNAKRQEANGELCAFLNAGYRRGAKAYRCTTNNKKIEPEEFDAFACVAVAGLRSLPDTLASRSIIVRMKRRAPSESVEQFRQRYHPAEARPIKDALEEWCQEIGPQITGAEPELPKAIIDRVAECWEPLIAIAEAAGGDWPALAREAAVHLTEGAADEVMTSGVELLAHIQQAFGNDEHLSMATLLDRLRNRDESPWSDIYGKPLDGRGLRKRLKAYEIRPPHTVRLGDSTARGYSVLDFLEAWNRYLPEIHHKHHKHHIIDNEIKNVRDVTNVMRSGQEVADVIDFEEQAAILEYDAGFDRDAAESRAAIDLSIPAFLRRKGAA